MRKSMKAALAVASAATFALGTALPASAGSDSASGPPSCAATFVNSTSEDYAYSSSGSGGCGTLRVEHYYTVPGYSGCTAWATGTAYYARTPVTPQLSSSKHQYAIMGVTYYRNVAG
jgi:hypothetical protein